jgi:hypothetical protein
VPTIVRVLFWSPIPTHPASGKPWYGDSVFACVDAQFLSTVLGSGLRKRSIPRSGINAGPLELYYELDFSGIDSVDFGPNGDIVSCFERHARVGMLIGV